MSRLTDPGLKVLVKLASIAVHVEEYLSPDGHPFDRVALEQLLKEEDLQAYMGELAKAGFLPVTRARRGLK